MLLRFHVKNFKQFKELELDFERVREYAFNRDCLTKEQDALKTLLIYGANASGKSNLGFALFDIVQHLFDKVSIPQAYRYYLNADNPNEPAQFSYKFKFGEDVVLYEYKKTSSTKITAELLSINGKLVFMWDLQAKRSDFSNLQQWGLDKLNNVYNNQSSYLRYAANNSNLKKSSPISRLMDFVSKMLWFRKADNGNNFIGFFSQPETIDRYIIDNNLVKDFEKFLSKFGVYEELEALTNPDGSAAIYCKHAKNLPFFGIASSGTSALAILYYWKKFFKSASFIFVDEYDAYYHSKTAEDVFVLLKKLKQQVIVATHNTNLLDYRFTRADCCFEIGNSSIKSFADRTQREIRAGNNLEKLYLAGEFDA